MRVFTILTLTCMFAAVGCSSDAGSGQAGGSSAQASVNSSRGGTITVAEQRWTLVPSVQCSIYPNRQVNIAGHAQGDASFEITVDYYPDGDGPVGLSGGKYGAVGSWSSVRESMKFEIDGRQFRGTGTFSVTTEQGPKSVAGSFEITC